MFGYGIDKVCVSIHEIYIWNFTCARNIKQFRTFILHFMHFRAFCCCECQDLQKYAHVSRKRMKVICNLKFVSWIFCVHKFISGDKTYNRIFISWNKVTKEKFEIKCFRSIGFKEKHYLQNWKHETHSSVNKKLNNQCLIRKNVN